MTINLNSRKHQSGAALVVALILLVALSLMAISSMNTASLDLIMAGNEQYRSRAFVVAEAGIERALIGGTYNTASTTSGSGSGVGNDTYSYTIDPIDSGTTQEAPPGYSTGGGQFGSIYFRITSNGTSERGTRSQTTQELFQVVKSGDSTTCDATANCDLGS